MELKPANAGDITLEMLTSEYVRTLSDFSRRFQRKNTVHSLRAMEKTWDTIKAHQGARASKGRKLFSGLELFTPFEGVLDDLQIDVDETVPERMVRVLNLDGEVIQEITI